MAHHRVFAVVADASIVCTDCAEKIYGDKITDPSLTFHDREGSEIYRLYSWEVGEDDGCDVCHEYIFPRYEIR